MLWGASMKGDIQNGLLPGALRIPLAAAVAPPAAAAAAGDRPRRAARVAADAAAEFVRMLAQ